MGLCLTLQQRGEAALFVGMPVPHSLLVAFCCAALSCGCGADADDEGEQAHESNGGSGSQDAEGLRLCCRLGAICHVAAESTDATVADCHELGHVNDPEACRSQYDECVIACAGVNDDPVEHACE